MSKKIKITNKQADLQRRQAAKLAELEARDEFEREWAMKDLTNPEKVGLSETHASLISDKLRQSYIKKEIIAQVEDDEELETDEDKDEDSVEDEVEFSEPEDSEEQGDESEKPSEKKPPFMQKEEPAISVEDEESPAEELGMGNLEEELNVPGETEDLGFPSDEGEDEIATPEDTLVPEDTDVLPEVGEIGGELGEPILNEEMPAEGGEVSLEPGKETTIELPGGYTLNLELLQNLATPEQEENIMAAKTQSVQERKAARRELIASIIREASEQAEPEQIKPSTEKALGDDTSHGGEKFVMEDATRGVANPGLSGDSMTLDNSGGNSLLSNPNFADNKVPTVNEELLANNPDAYSVNKFQKENGGLFTQKMEDTSDELPTKGETDDLWGAKNMIQGFELPTQLDSTKQRRTNVLANKVVECAGCWNEDEAPLSVVACDNCGEQYPLCSHCIEDNECPICASIQEENVREAAGLNLPAYCKDQKARVEICEGKNGVDQGDINGDMGFRVKRTEDDDEGDGNYDLEVNASTKIKKLERENQELQLSLAKFAKAAETATIMAYGGAIEVTDIPVQINKFMADKATNAAGLEHIRQTVFALAKKNNQVKLSATEDKMKRGASNKVAPASIGFNPNPSQERPFDHITDMKEALKGFFTCAKRNEDE